MKVKIKKLSNKAVIPMYSTEGSAGMDITCTGVNYKDKYIEYNTDIAMEIPEGYVGMIYPRSSISKYDLSLCNSVGIIDSDYRGEIKLRFNIENNIEYRKSRYETNLIDGGDIIELDLPPKIYEIGDRIAQLIIIPYPKVEFVEEELNKTDRNGGFGSTGKN